MNSTEYNMTLVNDSYTEYFLDPTIDCPDYDKSGDLLLDNLGFYLEGILQTSLAIAGLLSNFISCLVLASKEMRNSFNLMLIALALFDSGYLFGSILESFRKSFHMTTSLHVILFPYFLYPGQTIMMTASIFMTVAIAMERYVAVHYPLDYNQAMNDARASLRRLMKYVVPVVLFSILFNIPKFMEAEIRYETNSTDYPNEPYLEVTPLRKDPDYAIYYNNWTRLAVLGILPFLLLVYFNTKIYKDIQFRRSRRCPPRPPPVSTSRDRQVAIEAPSVDANTGQSSQSSSHSGCGGRVLRGLRGRAMEEADSPLSTGRRSLPHVNGMVKHNSSRRRQEDNLAVIFMGIVLVFLVSHLPRIFLSLHEMVVINKALECTESGKKSFPLWALVVGYFSHFLLVINSSGNCLIYCLLSSKFRLQAIKYARSLSRHILDLWNWILTRSACGKVHVTSSPSQFDPNHNGNPEIDASQMDHQQNGNGLVAEGSPKNSGNVGCLMNCGDNNSSSTTKNGIRWSKGMTTTAGGLKDEISLCDVRIALTQTTQV